MTDRNRMSDRELLVRIDERLENNTIRLDDHGKRLRVLERALLIGTGVLMAVGFVVEQARDSILGWVKHKLGGG